MGFAVLLIGLLAACAVRLAPSYDAIIVQGLTKSNEQAMTLFASLSGGASAGSFPEREQSYNELIGTLDATRLLAEARVNPPPPSVQLVGHRAGGQHESLEAPTPAILRTIVAGITRMRDADRSHGLSAFVVSGFKQSFEISMDQALTYEKALKR